mmetsp:Transcript_71218/g.206234  ORF Transcript_71218/g.206234 Transcript_71218/m.206234 type:complete len:252 (-) Transcript_71218:169-924(-)
MRGAHRSVRTTIGRKSCRTICWASMTMEGLSTTCPSRRASPSRGSQNRTGVCASLRTLDASGSPTTARCAWSARTTTNAARTRCAWASSSSRSWTSTCAPRSCRFPSGLSRSGTIGASPSTNSAMGASTPSRRRRRAAACLNRGSGPRTLSSSTARNHFGEVSPHVWPQFTAAGMGSRHEVGAASCSGPRRASWRRCASGRDWRLSPTTSFLASWNWPDGPQMASRKTSCRGYRMEASHGSTTRRRRSAVV